MSKKAKYKAVKDSLFRPQWYVEGDGRIVCQKCKATDARKIARALNAMDTKPKAKAWEFDWSGIPAKYKWAAMDDDCWWWIYAMKPCTEGDAEGWYADDDDNIDAARAKNVPPYPGDWRDSLQKRP